MARSDLVEHYIKVYTPADKPRCAECFKAKVSGDPGDPVATCAAGHGEKPLAHIIRPTQARGFRAARECADWEPAG